MIVIADTSPINYLILIEAIDILPKLYERIVVPPSVCEELQRQGAPLPVRQWIAKPPAWLHIVTPTQAPDKDLLEADLDQARSQETPFSFHRYNRRAASSRTARTA